MTEIIGIDVGKNYLHLHDLNSKRDFKIKNEFNEILYFFKGFGDKLNDIYVVFEPTGCYHGKLAKTLNELGVNYSMIPLDVIHNLNKILGESNKNDVIDAKKIAMYGKMIQEQKSFGVFKIRTVDKIPNEVLKLKAIYSQLFSMEKTLSRLRQLQNNIESNAFYDELGYINDTYKLQIEIMEETITKLYAEIDRLIKILGYEEKKQKIQSCPGVGPKISTILTIFFIEMEFKGMNKKDVKKVKKYAGLCPNQKQSGSSINKTKIIKRGNRFVRYYLSFGSMNRKTNLITEKRKHTIIAKFGLRMKEKFEGKSKKGGLRTNCAIANKLISVTRAMFCDNKEYEYR